MNYKWSGTTKLCNIAAYLADALDVPLAAIDLRFNLRDKGKVVPQDKGDTRSTLTHLRKVWGQ
jgi:hypothetical protein